MLRVQSIEVSDRSTLNVAPTHAHLAHARIAEVKRVTSHVVVETISRFLSYCRILQSVFCKNEVILV